ncbi:LysR family transcriptional regulator [Actinoallomurus sp. CA-150999]|uniref:LysR family transcriptional regulator n=1 Tax=Actinoallomurus sp. CA-150999 TaxID=3239887 RepID=UPI003D8FC478
MGYETFGLAPGLEEFLAVARHEHITRAAEQLGVPQPTLSRAIARLSADLGVPLVQREGRGIRLTRPGRQLAEHGDRVLADLLAALRAVRAEADPDTGTVVLGFLHSMGPSIVPDLLRAFRMTRPGVVVRLVHEGTNELLRQVLDGRVDLCLAAPVTRRLPPYLGSRRLAEQPLVLLVPSGHRLAEAGPVRLRDLGGEALITLSPAYGLRTLTDRLLSAARTSATYIVESQDIATASGLVGAGLGVAVLPAGSGIPGTVERPIADDRARRTISLIWRSDRPLTPPIADLRRHIIDAAPPLFAAVSPR